MCDLIDLKSPDGKKISGTKLASPLIPAPSQTSNGDKNDTANSLNQSGGLNYEKRNSLDNNPFDNAHHKTVEYARKQEDPFEVALERALTYKEDGSKSSVSKARTVDFKDDFVPKRRRYSDILKMNKTLDDSLTDLQLNTIRDKKEIQSSSVAATNVIEDSGRSDTPNKAKLCLPNARIIPRLCVESKTLDTSILNQSVMNDSLTESSGSVDENLLRSVIGLRINERIRGATKDPDFIVATDEIPKLNRQRRSLSQGDKMSPRKFRQRRSRSIVDVPIVSSDNEDASFVFSVPSMIYENTLNKGFLQTLSANNASVLSSLSNISSIARPTSVSSSNSSLALSNRTANCAFIESYANDGISGNFGNTEDDKIVDNTRLRFNDSATSSTKSPIEVTREESDLNDLILKYSKIREKSSESPTKDILPFSRLTNSIGKSRITNDKSVFPNVEDKLIDVDIFVPASKESPENIPRKSISSTSSDSVFVDSDAIEKSIFSEAKSLARTFEELAFKTGSSSTSSDDLLNSRPRWNFDILPLSDDEVLVDDLIELEKSAEKCDNEIANDPEESKKSTSSSDAKSDKSMMKDLEAKFKDPENKIIASTLLLDLEKLVKSENNSEAAELLKSLEKALGVKCESNVDLLSTCLTVRNDLAKSPRRNVNAEENENIKDDNNERSSEDNNDVETSDSFRQLSLSDDKSPRNNFNVDKEINTSDASSMLVSEKNNDSSTERIMNVSKVSSGKIHEDSIDSMKQHNQITDDQKMAVEILVGLGKLLTNENKDPMSSNLLKNLGIALNLATSNNCDNDDDPRSRLGETRRVGTPVKNRVATPPRKSSPLVPFTKTANRRSLELSTKAKTTAERVMRRSFSVSHTTTSTTPNVPRISNTPLSADKSKAHLKEGRKRFSSDPSCDLQSVNGRKSTKDITIKPVAVSELARQEKKPSSTVVGSVKNRLRKKAELDVASKKGPMKAIIPLGNMQRRGSFVKKESSLNGSITPPKPCREKTSAFNVTTSTPFPIVNLMVAPKKSPKSKPIASSTPDDAGTKNVRRSVSQIPQSPGRNAFSCNISPVTSKTSKNDDDNSSHNNSTSSRTSKICTPSKSRQSSQLPKLSPMLGTKTCSPKSIRGHRRSEPLQSYLPRSFGTPRSPSEKTANDGSTSPLNSSNKHGSTVKPLNLISKLGRRNNAGVAEKENYV